MNLDLTPFLISLKLSFITTLILFVITTPIAYLLANTKSKLKPFIESFIALPIVLPPTVIGFYFLVALSPNSSIGTFFYENFNINFLFSFTGLVIASCFYSLPFMMQPIQSAFESVDKSLIEASYLLKKSKIETFIKITMPLIKPSIIAACVITFAHTMGEFGVVLMIGGNIEGVTKVASIAIYDYVESLDFVSAHKYSLILIFFSYIVLVLTYNLKKIKT